MLTDSVTTRIVKTDLDDANTKNKMFTFHRVYITCCVECRAHFQLRYIFCVFIIFFSILNFFKDLQMNRKWIMT